MQDENNNIQAQYEYFGNNNIKYNVKNQLKELHSKAGAIYFKHDKQGNTNKETHYSYSFAGVSSTNQKQVLDCHLEQITSGNNSFQYNTLNQQIKVITKGGNTLVNRYDSEGLRYALLKMVRKQPLNS